MNFQQVNNNPIPAISLSTQYWLFIKRRTNLLLLIIFFIAGLYGLYQGFAFKSKQVAAIDGFQNEKISKYNNLLKGFDADTTSKLGKEAFVAVSSPLKSNWNIVLPSYKMPVSTAIFAIGQADVFPYYYTVKVESFFMQIFKQGEIANPLRSLSGHFDIAFWVIYLLPLLIILLCFNTLSAELGNGNWRLINSQGITVKKWLSSKFLFVGYCIEIMILIVFITALLLNYVCFNQSPSLNDFLFLLGVNIYLFFWLCLIYMVNTLAKNTGVNAMYCGIGWVVICILVPVLISMAIEKSIPINNTSISRMSRRPQGAQFEDSSFGTKIIRDLAIAYPMLKNTTIGTNSASFKLAVYLAYHKLLDDANTAEVKNYFTKIEARQQITNHSSIINSAASMDGIFASLANNDAQANHDFFWQTKTFHSRLNTIYYPALFLEKQLSKSDYKKMPIFKYQANQNHKTLVFPYTILILISCLLLFISNKQMSKIS